MSKIKETLDTFLSYWAIIWLVLNPVSSTAAVSASDCNVALGMQSGRIKDDQLKANSSYTTSTGPQFARLGNNSGEGAWCPKNHVTTNLTEWLEIDLQQVYLLTAVATQCRYGKNGEGKEFAQLYVLDYFSPQGGWHHYSDNMRNSILVGNSDTNTTRKTILDYPVRASIVRFIPFSTYTSTVCMRVEIYGCLSSSVTGGLISYTLMPQGDEPDCTYDGQNENGTLKNGLGLLADGVYGSSSNSTYNWVAWNEGTTKGQPVNITFEFDEVRAFQAVQWYAQEPFKKAEVFFSVNGKYYSNPLIFENTEGKKNEVNLTMSLPNIIGKYVKMLIYPAQQWMNLSEVSFVSSLDFYKFTFKEENTHGWLCQGAPYMAMAIGILLILVIVFFILYVKEKRQQGPETNTDTFKFQRGYDQVRTHDPQYSQPYK